MLPVTGLLNWNIMSFILRTREGKLVVIDGGHAQEKDYLLSVLRALSPDPDHIRVEAWLITHLHGDHFRALRTLLQDEKTAEFLEIGDVYLNLLEDRFYTELSPERIGEAPAVRHDLMNLPQRLGARVHIVNDDDSFTVDELTFRALHVPKMADAKLMDTNDSSVVWQMRVEGGQTVLFLSDAEFVCNNDLLTRCRADLPADIVQIGHHGCGNVSGRCYELIGANACIWQCGEKFWYQDSGEGLNTHNVGAIRTRAYIKEAGMKQENIYVTLSDIQAFPLPMPIY
jgi:beta-lactamase superfamily II metal-dependent hydrolase